MYAPSVSKIPDSASTIEKKDVVQKIRENCGSKHDTDTIQLLEMERILIRNLTLQGARTTKW